MVQSSGVGGHSACCSSASGRVAAVAVKMSWAGFGRQLPQFTFPGRRSGGEQPSQTLIPTALLHEQLTTLPSTSGSYCSSCVYYHYHSFHLQLPLVYPTTPNIILQSPPQSPLRPSVHCPPAANRCILSRRLRRDNPPPSCAWRYQPSLCNLCYTNNHSSVLPVFGDRSRSI